MINMMRTIFLNLIKFALIVILITIVVPLPFIVRLKSGETAVYNGMTYFVVQNNSIEPLLSVGDIMYSVKKPLGEIAIGDIVAFRATINDRKVIVAHRVYSTENGNIITKGEIFEVPEAAPVTAENFVGILLPPSDDMRTMWARYDSPWIFLAPFGMFIVVQIIDLILATKNFRYQRLRHKIRTHKPITVKYTVIEKNHND